VEVTRFERRNGRSIPNNTVSRVFPRVAGDIVCYTPNLKFQRIASVTDGPLAVDSFQAIAGGFLSEVPPSNPRCVSVLSELNKKDNGNDREVSLRRFELIDGFQSTLVSVRGMRESQNRIDSALQADSDRTAGYQIDQPFPDVDFFSADTSHGHVPRAPLKVEIILEVRE